MQNIRNIQHIFHGKQVLEGAGVRLSRAFGYYEVPKLDPFLMLDDFHSDNPDDYIAGFPWHPHRGIETVTYVLKGSVQHQDSMGNKGTIGDGDVQWMTAGSGIVHQEMPEDQSGQDFHGFQLWLNLPASEKMMHPRYRDVKAEHIPTVNVAQGVKAKVIAGEVSGIKGPVHELVVDAVYVDYLLEDSSELYLPTDPSHNVFVYVVEGELVVAGSEVGGRETVKLGPLTTAVFGPGDQLKLIAGASGVRFLFLSGKPLNEPVAWRGPIVMNTDAELETAFREYGDGTFLKHDPESFSY